MLKITGIMACDINGVISYKGKTPWNIPQELQHFKSTVCGNILIMGRKTYESMPANYDNTLYLVLSKNVKSNSSNLIYLTSLEKLKNLLLPDNKKLFMVGGAELFKLFIEHGMINDFILTKIHSTYKGDTKIDLSLIKNWPCNVIKKEKLYTIYHLIKPGEVT